MIDWDVLSGPLLSLIIGYALGSIPFGMIVTRLAGLGDVRNIGSGNIGATNVLRTGRKGLAAATLILDFGKGVVAVLIARHFWPDSGVDGLAAIAAFLGHLYPVWLGFRGGKGVATLIGIVAVLLWPAAIIICLVWLATLALTRYSSVSGMATAVAAPIAAFALGAVGDILLFAGFALLVLWKHRGNIARLRAGTEPKVGAGKA